MTLTLFLPFTLDGDARQNVLNKKIVPVNDKFLNSSPSNDMHDLNEMMKQLMSQVSNMMQIITLLLTKIYG